MPGTGTMTNQMSEPIVTIADRRTVPQRYRTQEFPDGRRAVRNFPRATVQIAPATTDAPRVHSPDAQREERQDQQAESDPCQPRSPQPDVEPGPTGRRPAQVNGTAQHQPFHEH